MPGSTAVLGVAGVVGTGSMVGPNVGIFFSSGTATVGYTVGTCVSTAVAGSRVGRLVGDLVGSLVVARTVGAAATEGRKVLGVPMYLFVVGAEIWMVNL